MRTRIAKWPDGQPFNVSDLFEEANTPNNIELNKKGVLGRLTRYRMGGPNQTETYCV